MTNILRIPANTQAYLFAKRDSAADKFDVTRFTYDYVNAAALSIPIANWPLDDAQGSLRVDTIGGRNLEEWYHEVGSTTGKIGNCVSLPNNYDVLSWQYDSPTSPNAPFPLGSNKFTLAVWMNRKSTGNSTGSEVYFNDVNGSRGGFIWIDSGLIARRSQVVSPNEVKDLSFSVTPEEWHFCVCWWDQADKVFYAQVDNGEVQSIATTQTWAGDILGVYVSNHCTSSSGFKADQFTLWNVVLTQAERDYLWNNGAGRVYP